MVDAVIFVEQLQRRFQTLRETVNRCGVETFVVDATDFKNESDLPTLGQENVWTDEPVEIDLLAEGAGPVVVLEDSAKPEHGHPFEPQSE